MEKTVHILGFILLSLICCNPASAVDPRSQISQYGHTMWRVEDSLSNAAPNAIAQSSDGYIWIGTETGLLRFDGARFVPWTPPQWENLSAHEVSVLYAATDGTLWIGNSTNIASWKNGVLKVIDTGGSVYVNKIVEDSAHDIWFVTSRRADGKSLCRISGPLAKCFGAADGIPSWTGASLVTNADGSFSLISDDTLIDWSPKTGLLATYKPESLKAGHGAYGVSALLNLADGSKLIGFANPGKGLGLERLIGSSWAPYMKDGFDGSKLGIQELYTDSHGATWIGSRADGLYRVNGDTVDHYDRRSGLSGSLVKTIYEDREGNLWVGTDGGIDCFRNLKAVPWSADQGLPAGHVRSVLATRDNSVLVGIDDTLSLLREGKVSLVSSAPGMPQGFIVGLAEDLAGRFWVGVNHQLAIYDGHRFTLVKRPNGEPIGLVFSLSLAPDGTMWAIVFSKALPRELIHLRDGKIVDSIGVRGFGLKVVSDGGRGAWVNGQGRIAHYVGGKVNWVQLVDKTDPNNFSVQDDLVSSKNGTVFFSSRLGLWVIRNSKAKLVSPAAGLPCNDVNGLALSQNQSLWMRTSCGLIEIDAATIDSWWSNPNQEIAFRLIDSTDGARPSRTVFFPQMSFGADGRVWVGSDSGIEVVDSNHTPANLLPPPVHIEEVLADQKELRQKTNLQIAPLTRDLEVHYSALSLAVPQKVKFKYMLEGRDSSWQDAGTRRIAFYNDLKPGSYKFHVIAANNDGIWNNNGDSLAFYVKPAWFQTVWFRTLALLLFIAALWTAYRWRVDSAAKAIRARFRERLDERTRLAREIHDTLLQTLQGSKMVADNALGPDGDEVRMRNALQSVSGWLDQAITEGRAAVHALRVPDQGRDELSEHLEKILKEHCGDSSLSAALTVVGESRDVAPIVRDELSLIAREAVRNVCLHSQATELRLEIRFAENLTLQVNDNGVGIDPEIASSGKDGHFGLQTMKERSRQIHATLDIRNGRNRGTEVSLLVPGAVAYPRDHQTRGSIVRSLLEHFETHDGD